MANKKLIEDLESLAELDGFVAGVAQRALEEIEYLENQIECRESEIRWADFKPGDMK